MATPPPDAFEVTIEATHELHTGGRLTGEGAGRGGGIGQIGRFGILAMDASGAGLSAVTRDGSGAVTSYDTQAWMSAKGASGRVDDAGDKVLTLAIVHTGSWAKNDPPQETGA